MVKFIFMLKKIFKMIKIKNELNDQNKLTKEEILTILNILKESKFPVKDIEHLYKALIKLQEQYKNG